MLELVRESPDWLNALGVALTRPPGVPERRQGQDPWHPENETASRPRRIADDLAWLRQAYDEPEENGLRPLEDTAAVAASAPHAALRRHPGPRHPRRPTLAWGPSLVPSCVCEQPTNHD